MCECVCDSVYLCVYVVCVCVHICCVYGTFFGGVCFMDVYMSCSDMHLEYLFVLCACVSVCVCVCVTCVLVSEMHVFCNV